MTLTELRYAIILAEVKHFARAAKRCHVSQPTLSTAIQKLEKDLGVVLFERDRQQLRLTEPGILIIEQAQRVLESANALYAIAKINKSELETPLKIGAIYTVGPYLFPALIPQLKKLAPNMSLMIQEDFTANLRRKLQQGELDAIFISLPFNESACVTQLLYDEPFVVLMRRDHPLSAKKSLCGEDLVNENILLLGEGHCFRDEVIAACPQCYPIDRTLPNTFEGTSLETLRHMVASGLGMTILPMSATQIEHYSSSLCIKPFQGAAPKRQIALAWRISFTRPKAIGVLVKAIQATHIKGIQVKS